MSETARMQAEGLQFLREYRSAFTTRGDGSKWPKYEQTWLNAAQYFRGLLRPGSYTTTDIADKMHTDQERLERFVRKSPWEHENVEAELRERAPEAVQGDDAAVIVDGMGIPKAGDDSVGVSRQWCGATGKIDNCQVTANCTLARPGERHNTDQVTWPLGMRLYLSKQWADAADADYDSQQERERYAQRRNDANLPDEIEYQSKRDLAVASLAQIAATDLDYGCIVGDSHYGGSRKFRQELRDLNEPYILETPPAECPVIPEQTPIIHPDDHPRRTHEAYPEDVSPETPAEVADRIGDDWTEVTWNDGTKGPMSGEFYRTRIRTVKRKDNRWVSDETGWLLLQKDHSGGDDSDNNERKAWVCWGVDEASLNELVSWAKLRWTVEQFHRDIKQNLGADEYQGRTWKGVHHHLAVVMLAHAFVVQRRLETGVDRTDLSSFEEVIGCIVQESAVQGLMEDKGCDRQRAEELAEYMLESYAPW